MNCPTELQIQEALERAIDQNIHITDVQERAAAIRRHAVIEGYRLATSELSGLVQQAQAHMLRTPEADKVSVALSEILYS